MSRRRVQLNVDERTDDLTDEAVVCRAVGHQWSARTISRQRLLDLLDRGLAEYYWACANGCGTERFIVWDVTTGDIVEKKLIYPTESEGRYLLRNGSGRLPRSSARVASFARQYGDLIK